MKPYELAAIIALALIAVSVTIGAVFLIIAFVKAKKMTIELERALRKLNSELDVVSKVSSKVASLTEKISSPIISAISLIFYALSSVNKRKKQKGEESE
jgi:uncharacterized protein YoxC